MTKKQILGSIIILIILSLICMHIYDTYKLEIKTTILITEEETNKNQLVPYYNDDITSYYLYGLQNIIVDFQDHTIALNKAFETRQIDIYEVLSYTSKEKTYADGAILYKNKDFSILQCNNSPYFDYYFGKPNMEYEEGFCQELPYICHFIKTYLILDASESNDQRYMYLTLKQFQAEEVETIKIEKSLVPELEEDQYYEFTFGHQGLNQEETIKEIFEHNILLSIIKTEKVGLDQINESICK